MDKQRKKARNHFTSITSLWLNHYAGETIHGQIMEQAQAAKDQAQPLEYLADYLRDFVINHAPGQQDGLYKDLLDEALQKIHFKAIAADFLEEANT